MGPAVRHKGQGIRHGALQKPRHYRGRALWSESEMSLMHSVPTCGSAGPAFLTYSHQADPLPKGHTSRSASSPHLLSATAHQVAIPSPHCLVTAMRHTRNTENGYKRGGCSVVNGAMLVLGTGVGTFGFGAVSKRSPRMLSADPKCRWR